MILRFFFGELSSHGDDRYCWSAVAQIIVTNKQFDFDTIRYWALLAKQSNEVIYINQKHKWPDDTALNHTAK